MRGLGFIIAAVISLVLSAPVAAQSVAEGQSHADYLAWLAREPAARAQVLAFTQFLDDHEAADVVPTWQLVRTASMWRECSGPRFEVAPLDEWQHIAATLRFVHREVEPAIGPVEALSGYRNEQLNQCSGGARQSAHRHFYALDLTPIRADIDRGGMIDSICRIHQSQGAAYDVGLGFYSGLRFHVDSKGFRRWGPDGSGATSPCVTGIV